MHLASRQARDGDAAVFSASHTAYNNLVRECDMEVVWRSQGGTCIETPKNLKRTERGIRHAMYKRSPRMARESATSRPGIGSMTEDKCFTGVPPHLRNLEGLR